MLFLELLVVERLVYLKLYLNTQTVKSSSTSAVEKEETKWLKSCSNSLLLLLSKTAKRFQLCKELLLSQTLQTCLSLHVKLPSILVSLWLSISETWVVTSP